MTIQTFIEKAIEGEWRPEEVSEIGEWSVDIHEFCWNIVHNDGRSSFLSIAFSDVLLDPSFWKALGKVEGWKICSKRHEHFGYKCHVWLFHMHSLIDTLAEGKTIEQYLETL